MLKVSEPTAGRHPADRIVILDILRGMALLGMILVHFNGRAAGGAAAGGVIQTSIDYLLDSKAHAIFAMLFGVGFAIQFSRADQRGANFTLPFLRRLAGLAVFGFVAEAAFGYDVLLGYALWALPLLFLRQWSTRALLGVVLLCAMSYDLYYAGLGSYRWAVLGAEGANAAAAESRQHNQAVRAARREAIGIPDYSHVSRARVRHMGWFYRQPFSLTPWNELVFFLIGLLGLRIGVWQQPLAHRRLIIGFMLAGLISWIAENFVLPLPWPALPVADVEQPLRAALGLLRDTWLAFTLAGAVLLLAASSFRWRRRLGIFAAPGRMALTNYMIHVAVIDVVTSPYGVGLVLPPELVPLASIELFLAEMLFSQWWLRRFQMGPAEWVLRCITDARWRPIRREEMLSVASLEGA